MMPKSLSTIALGAALLSAPNAIAAQASCKDIPDFDIFLRQTARTREAISARPEQNQAGSPLTIWFRYDTTRATNFELLTNPPGGTVTKGPAYLRDADGTKFTNKDLGNKRVIDTATVQFRNCLRDVILRGEPYGRRAVAKDTTPTPLPPAPNITIENNVNNHINIQNNIIIAPTRIERVTDTVRVHEERYPNGFVGVFLGAIKYSGSKNTGVDFANEFPLSTDESKIGLDFQALYPFTKRSKDGKTYVSAVLAAQRFGASGLNVELKNPAGAHVAREDAAFSFLEANASWHPLRNGTLGVRATYDRGDRKLTEIAVESPARPDFTSVNPTVTNNYALLEAVFGPAHLNVSAGFAHQSLSDDPLTDGGNGWTVQGEYNGFVTPRAPIPVWLRARHSSVRGDELEGPNGPADYKGSRTRFQAQIAPIALVHGLANDFDEQRAWHNMLQAGVLHVRHQYEAGISQPEQFTTLYFGVALPLPGATRTNHHEETP